MSPLDDLAPVKAKVVRQRRALTADEQRALVAYTAMGEDQHGQTRLGEETWRMTGPERALLYELALVANLRASDYATLKRESFQLHEDRPQLVCRVAKTGTMREIPLPKALALKLRDHLKTKSPGAVAFDMPDSTDTAGMIRADLNAARSAWVQAATSPKERQQREESYFLRERDQSGHRADFHSLRASFGTSAALAGLTSQ